MSRNLHRLSSETVGHELRSDLDDGLTECRTVPSSSPTPDSTNPTSSDVVAALIENRQVFLGCLTRHIRSADIAEDVLQQFTLRAISKTSDIRHRASILPWLFRVLHSTLADFYRAETARRQGESVYTYLHPTVVNQFSSDNETACMCFDQRFPMIKPEYAEIFQRIELNSESREEVAEALGITVNLVRVRLHRARRALRKAFLASCQGCTNSFMNCECSHT